MRTNVLAPQRTTVTESALERVLNQHHPHGEDESNPASCQYCGCHPFALTAGASSALTPRSRLGSRTLDHIDQVDDDEADLWQLVAEGDQALADAPTAPSAEEIAAARRALAAANATVRRVEAQVTAVEIALSRTGSWLRPRHRADLTRSLRRGRAAVIAAAGTRDQAATAFAEMDRRGAQLRSYLATYRTLLESADDARQELDRRVDDVINTYAKSSEPPPWFRFGLGYPPRAETYAEWLRRARAAIAYRRRNHIDHPLEPTGGQPFE
jgi:hypothetical protein